MKVGSDSKGGTGSAGGPKRGVSTTVSPLRVSEASPSTPAATAGVTSAVADRVSVELAATVRAARQEADAAHDRRLKELAEALRTGAFQTDAEQIADGLLEAEVLSAQARQSPRRS